MADADKLETRALCHVTRYIGDDGKDKTTELEVTDWSDGEVEFAFTFDRHRYYVRVRRDDLIRFAKIDYHKDGSHD